MYCSVAFIWMSNLGISFTNSEARTALYSIINSTTGKYWSVAFVWLGFYTQTHKLEEGCPIRTTCSSCESEDSSGATRMSFTSHQVVNVIHFSEITWSISWCLWIRVWFKEGSLSTRMNHMSCATGELYLIIDTWVELRGRECKKLCTMQDVQFKTAETP